MAADLIITRARLGGGTIVAARGAVDAGAMPVLDGALRRAADDDPRLTIDLSGLAVEGAAATALLLHAIRRVHARHPRMLVVCPPGPFRSALERTGLTRRVAVTDRAPAQPSGPVEPFGAEPRRPEARRRGKRRPTAERRGALLTEGTVAIEARYADPDLTLDQVARRVATSSRQLQRVFAELAGSTFRAELNAVRMQHAAELLVTTALPVSEIARRVGHRQPAQFANAFRRHHGVSPTAFRAAERRAT